MVSRRRVASRTFHPKGYSRFSQSDGPAEIFLWFYFFCATLYSPVLVQGECPAAGRFCISGHGAVHKFSKIRNKVFGRNLAVWHYVSTPFGWRIANVRETVIAPKWPQCFLSFLSHVDNNRFFPITLPADGVFCSKENPLNNPKAFHPSFYYWVSVFLL